LVKFSSAVSSQMISSRLQAVYLASVIYSSTWN
jgi:hypothetical protein